MTGDLFYAVFHTVAGWAGLLGSEAGLRRATLPQHSEAGVTRLLGIENSPAGSSPGHFKSLIERLQAYYDGCPADFDDKLDLSGSTEFQRSVWQATRLIPYGETRSYAWVAGQIGSPKASRAVGQALKRNPLPVIVPCHRVVAGNGTLGGFGGGEEIKRYLLALEMIDDIR
jgi:methylated-DNA-[protein]-cysteine S-methyltransferase